MLKFPFSNGGHSDPRADNANASVVPTLTTGGKSARPPTLAASNDAAQSKLSRRIFLSNFCLRACSVGDSMSKRALDQEN